jgi:RimJ/RimL family protein N-acetyltransferase
VRLAPVTPADHRYLYDLASHSEVSYRWRFRNHLPRFETFVQGLDTDTLAQFVVRHLPDDEPLGHVVCYAPDLVNRHASIAGIVDPSVAGLHMGAEALSLLIDHLFTSWDLEKLYAEVPEFVDDTMAGRIVEPFRLEARFRSHLFYAGRRWDFLVYALDRSAWPGFAAWEFNPTEPGPLRRPVDHD